jgi:transposase InsO family protein
VKILHEQQGYPVELACDLLDLPRSNYYYRSHPRDDPEVVPAMKAIAGQFPTYGILWMTNQLRRSPHRLVVNHKRVEQIMGQEGLLQPRRRKKCRTTNSEHPYPRYPNLVKDLEVNQPEQVWVSDITYIRLGNGFVYLAIVMDVFTRAIRGWALSKTLDGELTLLALRFALAQRCPQIHHSDQGLQYAAGAYTALLLQHRVQVSMAAVGKAEENGYAERFMRTIKEEEVDLSEYRNFADAKSQIGHFIDQVYLTKRIHSSLGYLTPAEFEASYWAKYTATMVTETLSTP